MAEGFALGLSTGTVCFVTCAPIYLPWLMAEKKNIWLSFLKLMEISAGRFIAYILFGALAGYFGGKLNPVSRNLFTGISYILLSVFLVLNVYRTHREGKSCKVPRWALMSKSAVLLGFFTGVNFCPSFLIALSSAVELGGVFSGIQIFLGFFFGTSLFLLPLALSSYLTILKEIKLVARYATLIIALWFVWQGIHNLMDYRSEYLHNRDTILMDLAKTPFEPVLISSSANQSQAFSLRDSLSLLYHKPTQMIVTDSLLTGQLPSQSNEMLLLLDQSALRDSIPGLSDFHRITLSDESSYAKLMPFLRGTVFRLKKDQAISFRL